MKRALVFVLILLLAIPFGASRAEENPMRSLTLKAEIDGDVLDVRFVVDMAYPNKTSAFESMDFVLTYSERALELIELVKSGDLLESDMIDNSFITLESIDQKGRFEYHCASALGIRGSGLLLHLRFRIIGEGAYMLRVKSDGYSIYDSASDRAQSYRFPLLKTDIAPYEDTKLPEISDAINETGQTEQPADTEKGWFAKMIESIFGSSCRCGK